MAIAAEGLKKPRRKRRTREDVAERLREAARTLFAERGYAATTTKEIARVADVSETLLFRYYGGKEALFDEVISAPFNRLMQDFVARHADASSEATRDADARRFVAQVFQLFDSNRQLFSALTAAPATQREEQAPVGLRGLETFFEQSVEQQLMAFKAAGQKPDFDLAIGVRLGFGMIAAGVLLRDWLFPEGAPPDKQMTDALEHMIARALGPREGPQK